MKNPIEEWDCFDMRYDNGCFVTIKLITNQQKKMWSHSLSFCGLPDFWPCLEGACRKRLRYLWGNLHKRHCNTSQSHGCGPCHNMYRPSATDDTKIVKNYIFDHALKNHPLHPNQQSYQKGKSTERALARLVEMLRQ